MDKSLNKELELEIISNDSYEHTYKTLGKLYNLKADQVRHIFRKNKALKKVSKLRSAFELTSEEKEEFYKEYNNHALSFFQNKFETSEKVLRNLLKAKGLKKDRVTSYKGPDDWSSEQLKILKENYLDCSVEELSKMIGKTPGAITTKRGMLRLVPDKRWSEEEDELLKKYVYLPYDALSFLLERSTKSIKHRLSFLKLKRSMPQKTSIEVIVEDILKRLGIDYIYNEVIPNSSYNFRPDFRIESHKIIIEVHGDYWHANLNIYSKDFLNEMQVIAIEKDNIKKEVYEKLGYTVFIVWEEDLREYLEQTTLIIKELFVNKAV